MKSNGVSEDFPKYFINKSSRVNKSSSRRMYGKRMYRNDSEAINAITNSISIESIVEQNKIEKRK